MHEFSIASLAVDKIIETASFKKAKKIRAVEIAIGELSMLGEEQLTFWIKQMLDFKSKIAEDVNVGYLTVKAEIRCKKCGYEGNIKKGKQDHLYPVFKCPKCTMEDVEIIKGRECLLNKIQVEL
ncbi:MAG: hydrogenase/urease maturation nickel metallochaperone HypA [bacterium]